MAFKKTDVPFLSHILMATCVVIFNPLFIEMSQPTTVLIDIHIAILTPKISMIALNLKETIWPLTAASSCASHDLRHHAAQ